MALKQSYAWTSYQYNGTDQTSTKKLKNERCIDTGSFPSSNNFFMVDYDIPKKIINFKKTTKNCNYTSVIHILNLPG